MWILRKRGGGGGAATVNAYAVFKYKSLSSKLMPLERDEKNSNIISIIGEKFEFNSSLHDWVGKLEASRTTE